MEHGIIAKTGRTTGKPDKSAVIREAINMLESVDATLQEWKAS